MVLSKFQKIQITDSCEVICEGKPTKYPKATDNTYFLSVLHKNWYDQGFGFEKYDSDVEIEKNQILDSLYVIITSENP